MRGIFHSHGGCRWICVEFHLDKAGAPTSGSGAAQDVVTARDVAHRWHLLTYEALIRHWSPLASGDPPRCYLAETLFCTRGVWAAAWELSSSDAIVAGSALSSRGY